MIRARLAGVWLLVLCSWHLHDAVTAQFLKTTCPRVPPANCPGLCSASAASKEKGQCTGQGRRSLAEAGPASASGDSPGAHSSSATPAPTRAAPAAAEDDSLADTGRQYGWEEQQAAEDGSVPQRVLPYGSGDQPVESTAQQQAIIQRLQALYEQGDNNSDSPTTAKGGCPTTATDRKSESHAVAAAVSKYVSKSYSGPDSQVARSLTFLQNSKIKVGLDMERAGTISWVSSPIIPAPWRDKNLINVWDQGRLLQQSFYGCVDGSCWATRPWLWNPVQGGSWENEPGATVKKSVEAGKRIFVQGTPRNWGKQNLIQPVLLASDVTLKENYIVAKFTMKYSGSTTHPYMTQEVPAVFVDRRFSVLAYYDGTKPWTNDRNVKYAFPPGRNIYARPTEFWAAFIDPVTGWGVGVFNPKAWMGITAYRIGHDGSDKPWDCSYFAHTIRMQLHPGMRDYTYTTYITVGKLDTIRATFNKLRATPGVMPTVKSGEPGSPDSQLNGTSGSGLTTGQPDLGRNAWYGSPANYSSFDNVIVEQQQHHQQQQQGVAAANTAGVAADGTAAEQAGVGDSSDAGGKAAAGGPDSQAGASGTAAHLAAAGSGDAAGADAAGRETGKTNAGVVAGVVVAACAGCALLVGAGLAVHRRKLHAVRAHAAGGVNAGAGGSVDGPSSSAAGTEAEGPLSGVASDEGVVAAVGVTTRAAAALGKEDEQVKGSGSAPAAAARE